MICLKCGQATHTITFCPDNDETVVSHVRDANTGKIYKLKSDGTIESI